MADRIGLVFPRPMGRLAWVPLVLYVLLRGFDATALKWLQLQGAAQTLNGVNPISFCNVFFVAQLIAKVCCACSLRHERAQVHSSKEKDHLFARDACACQTEQAAGRHWGTALAFRTPHSCVKMKQPGLHPAHCIMRQLSSA